MKKISILGSTGSIGTQTLEVAEAANIEVLAISGYKNLSLLEKQVRKYSPKLVAVLEEEDAKKLKNSIADTSTKVVFGEEGLCMAASIEGADMVVTSIVGNAGLVPTLAAIDAKKDIALANKETLVTAGEIVIERAKQKGVKIVPVDSEHSAVFQSLQAGKKDEVEKVILTASGGSFYGKTKDYLENVTVEQALNHPNWSMGKKITIDSATLMNKGLEVIEAHWLFDVGYDKIDVLIHRESIIHSMVHFCDGSVIAQLGVPDMKLPIHYALHYPKRVKSITKPVNLAEIGKLTFDIPDYETFKALPLAIEAGKIGGTMPCAVNAANEVAVEKFLNGEINFNKIYDILENTLAKHKNIINPTIEDIINTDKEVRNYLK